MTRSDFGLVLRAFWILPRTAIELRLFGYGRTRERLARRQEAVLASAVPHPLARARRTQRLVLIASNRGLVRGACLSRSLTLMELLCRQGIAARLHIGVRNPSEAFQAHAWVEYNGVVLNEHGNVRTRYTHLAAMNIDAVRPMRRSELA